MSVSTIPTRCPCRAMSTARFAVVFDFPVPPRNECTATIFDKRLLSPCQLYTVSSTPSVSRRLRPQLDDFALQFLEVVIPDNFFDFEIAPFFVQDQQRGPAGIEADCFARRTGVVGRKCPKSQHRPPFGKPKRKPVVQDNVVDSFPLDEYAAAAH